MRRKLQYKMKRYLRNNSRQTMRQLIICSLSFLVLCCTVVALIDPAVSMEYDTFCGLDVHVHTEECFGPPVCQSETTGLHIHGEACYAQEQHLVCTLPEQSGHIHSGECESTGQTLICGLEESEEHGHTELCYEAVIEYACGLEEAAAHTHSDICYTTEQITVCTLEETVPETHVHTQSCYPEIPVCALEEHEHQLICYSDPEADLETAALWEKTLPGELSGLWSDDLAAIAQSQLGYQESKRNYIVENEEKSGYTRYGAWAGTPYAHWNELFVAFCLEYAGVPQEALPRCSGSQLWLEALAITEQLEAPGHLPVPGDLIFLNADGQDGADRMGIVASISEDGAAIEVIEGDSDGCVRSRSYAATDAAILGYGILPDNSAAILAEGDAYTVWIDATNGDNPFYKGVSCIQETVSEGGTITLPTAAEIGSPTDYSYTVRAWYDIATKTAYFPGDTVTVTENMVFYADWVASSYNIGRSLPGHDVESESTKDFVTVSMFDYNDLVNLNAATLNESRAAGASRETWTALSPSESRLLPLNTWRASGNSLDCPAYSLAEGESVGIYRGNSSNGIGYITEGLFPYAVRHYFDRSGRSLGVNYVGTGDYLFQYDKAQGYYFFNSHINGAAYNRSEGRFYIYDAPSKTTCTDSAGAASQGDYLPFNIGHGNHQEYYIDHDGTGNRPEDANYWYGMHIAIEFYLPAAPNTEDGLEMNKAANGNPMIYYFSGDDDVWVLVDGCMVLDMGGIHEPVTGFINFANGRVCTTDANGNVTDTKLDALIPGFTSGDHTLEMYYMERGGGMANCEVYFNLAARQNLQINKVDRQLPNNSMEGTVFTVYEDADCTVLTADLYSDADRRIPSSTFTIGADNQDTLYGFYCKKIYYVKETKAPEGYEPADRVLKIEFDYNGTMSVTPLPENTLPGYDGNVYAFINDDKTDNDNLGIVTVYNAKTTDELTLRKIWYKADGTVDTGKTTPVTVDIYRTTEKDASAEDLTELYKTVTISDGSGGVLTAVLENVEQYDSNKQLYYYFVKERTVDGYAATYIRNGAIAGSTITVTNAPDIPVEYERPTFTLTKKDDAGNLLPGAVFRLYEYSNTAGSYIWVGDYTVGSSGTIDFHEELDYNTAYYLQELQAPEGYLKNPNPLFFGIRHSDTALYPMSAPGGFTWTSADSQGQYGSDVVNYGHPAVTLEKVDSANHDSKLSGAKFAMYQWNGTGWVELHIGLTTDENGKLELDDLDYNTVYKIVETTAPDGYFLEDLQIVFQVPAPEGYGFAETSIPGDVTVQAVSGGTTISVENEKMPGVTLKKVNQDGTLPLAGAEFTLSFYADGTWKEIRNSVVTDTGGSFTLDKLSYDTLYRLQETKAPDGYLIDAEYHYFWIRSGEDLLLNMPEDVSEDQILAMEAGEEGYVLTVKNNKIPTLSVVKEWYIGEEKVENAELYAPITFDLFQKAVRVPAATGDLTVSVNLGASWSGDNFFHPEDITGVAPGSTLQLTLIRTGKSIYYDGMEIKINGSTWEPDFVKEDLGNSTENLIYTLEMTIDTSTSITGTLTTNGTWEIKDPVIIPPAGSETEEIIVTKINDAPITLSAENNWRYDHLDELAQNQRIQDEGKWYDVAYTYYVTESPVPDGYDVRYDNNNLSLDTAENKVITIQNQRNGQALTSLTVTKTDAADSGITLPGATFTLSKWDSTLSDWTAVSTRATGDDGKLTFLNLSYNTAYKLVETEAPFGYTISGGPRYFFFAQEDTDTYPVSRPDDEIAYTESTSVEIANEKRIASLSVEKKWFDIDGNEALPEDIDKVSFELHRRAKTTDGSLIDLDYSLYGTFSIREKDGWKLDIYDLPGEGTLEINGVSTNVSYVYYVKELPISFYSTTYGGQNALPNTGASIVITNTEIPSYELPETGGSGAGLYALGCLLTTAAALACDRKRRHKR